MPTPTSAPLSDLVGPILAATNILAFCHVNPDGDAIGALLGLGDVLEALPVSSGAPPRRVTLACQDPAPEILRFLPGARPEDTGPGGRRIVNVLPPGIRPDLVISLDASDPARLGKIFAGLAFSPAPLLVIDHHITNLHFGDVNYVAPEAASTSQLVVALADALGVPLPSTAAVPLLVGLVTDTLGFRTSNVTAAEMACAVRLMEAGANLADIAQRTLATRPLKFMRLWGMALTAARLDGHVLWAEVTRGMRAAAGIDDDDDGGLVSQLDQRVRGACGGGFQRTGGRPDRSRLSLAARLRRGRGRTEPGRRRASAGRRVQPARPAGRGRSPRPAVGAGRKPEVIRLKKPGFCTLGSAEAKPGF